MLSQNFKKRSHTPITTINFDYLSCHKVSLTNFISKCSESHGKHTGDRDYFWRRSKSVPNACSLRDVPSPEGQIAAIDFRSRDLASSPRPLDAPFNFLSTDVWFVGFDMCYALPAPCPTIAILSVPRPANHIAGFLFTSR